MNTFLILVTYKTRPGVRKEFLNKIYASDILKESYVSVTKVRKIQL